MEIDRMAGENILKEGNCRKGIQKALTSKGFDLMDELVISMGIY